MLRSILCSAVERAIYLEYMVPEEGEAWLVAQWVDPQSHTVNLYIKVRKELLQLFGNLRETVILRGLRGGGATVRAELPVWSTGLGEIEP
jgi:hypothetical protein